MIAESKTNSDKTGIRLGIFRSETEYAPPTQATIVLGKPSYLLESGIKENLTMRHFTHQLEDELTSLDALCKASWGSGVDPKIFGPRVAALRTLMTTLIITMGEQAFSGWRYILGPRVARRINDVIKVRGHSEVTDMSHIIDLVHAERLTLTAMVDDVRKTQMF